MKLVARKIRILFVAGTRPNFMKVAPLLRECEKYPNGEKLVRQFKRILSGRYKKSNIPAYWDGKTSERIVKKIKDKFG